ncbi:MAG: tyrosine--tRNA ligase [Candidatus Peribacteraceae bacterium]|nr:tyrosine--tRNA ligase [Candidatus Peribacteraceae bacterium]
MDIEKRFDLIKRNTEEIISESELKDLLKKKKHPSAYIGLAITGRPHIGYFIPMLKVSDFLKAGFRFKILFADIHGHLDDQKTPFELLDKRMKYYIEVISGMLDSIGVDKSKLEFVKGRDFELDPKYTLDMYKLSALSTFSRCKRAASEVVRFRDESKLSGFIYPILQTLDEEYLNVDVQYGGHDQRKILMFARESLPKIGYRPRVEVMTPMLPGLSGGKMSSSENKSKIDLLDSEKDVEKKISSAYCPAGSEEENGVLAFIKHVIMVIKTDKKEEFKIERPEKFGGNVSYSDYQSLHDDFMNNKLHPMDLKKALSREVNILLEPIRKKLKNKTNMVKEAYPE